MYEFDGEDFTGQKASATSPLHLPYISPTSHYISPTSPLHLPHISPTSPLHLPYISPTSPPYLPCISPSRRRARSASSASYAAPTSSRARRWRSRDRALGIRL